MVVIWSNLYVDLKTNLGKTLNVSYVYIESVCRLMRLFLCVSDLSDKLYLIFVNKIVLGNLVDVVLLFCGLNLVSLSVVMSVSLSVVMSCTGKL